MSNWGRDQGKDHGLIWICFIPNTKNKKSCKNKLDQQQNQLEIKAVTLSEPIWGVFLGFSVERIQVGRNILLIVLHVFLIPEYIFSFRNCLGAVNNFQQFGPGSCSGRVKEEKMMIRSDQISGLSNLHYIPVTSSGTWSVLELRRKVLWYKWNHQS